MEWTIPMAWQQQKMQMLDFTSWWAPTLVILLFSFLTLTLAILLPVDWLRVRWTFIYCLPWYLMNVTRYQKKAQRKQRKSTLHDDSHKWNHIKWTKIKAFCSQIQPRAPLLFSAHIFVTVSLFLCLAKLPIQILINYSRSNCISHSSSSLCWRAHYHSFAIFLFVLTYNFVAYAEFISHFPQHPYLFFHLAIIPLRFMHTHQLISSLYSSTRSQCILRALSTF